MTITGQQFDISSGRQWAAVSEVGAQLRGYRVDGRDVTHVNGVDQLPPKSCGAVLMPWPNRVRGGRYRFAGVDYQLALSEPALGNASHGLAAWSRWILDEHRADEVRLHCDVVPQRGWPFELRTEIGYRLDPEIGLVVTMGARNVGAAAFPFGAGMHPYLHLAATDLDAAVITVPGARRFETDDVQIPVGSVAVGGTDYDLRAGHRLGARRLDTAYTDLVADDDGKVRVHVDFGGRRSTVWMDHPDFAVAQVFTLDDLGGAGAAVAVEPMTCPADAFNSGHGLHVLEPGQSWTARWGLTHA